MILEQLNMANVGWVDLWICLPQHTDQNGAQRLSLSDEELADTHGTLQ